MAGNSDMSRKGTSHGFPDDTEKNGGDLQPGDPVHPGAGRLFLRAGPPHRPRARSGRLHRGRDRSRLRRLVAAVRRGGSGGRDRRRGGAGLADGQGTGDRRSGRHRAADATGGPGPVRQRDPGPHSAGGAREAALPRPGEQPGRGCLAPDVAQEPAGAAAGRQRGDGGARPSRVSTACRAWT